jgi:hypothetical protein
MDASHDVHFNPFISWISQNILSGFVEVAARESLSPLVLKCRIAKTIHVMEASCVSRVYKYKQSIEVNNSNIVEAVHMLPAFVVPSVIRANIRGPINTAECPIQVSDTPRKIRQPLC